ncbi:hypothetical protein N7532_008663 [Penicillium argentinense]|uniref:Uncharacterized protein n=1 Tax=Penicillium argentinense TaxID=1131581 RepID=A0A9W9EY13_9EURO|nr:uncharacterized protein N7532_008663 [Penicillium argentinense]KAJ5089979.1 hypothetical protein N7532_008663 [Penicillium argentinense]
MMIDRLKCSVEEGDLIMVFPAAIGIDAPVLYVVEYSPPETRYPRTDEVIVSYGRFSRTPREGFWYLDGPSVEYVPYDDDTMHPKDEELMTLKEVFEPFQIPSFGDNETIYTGFSYDINPIGRSVLHSYFRGVCPLCHNDVWYPDLNYDQPYPELFVTEIDQACPCCLGYECARNDANMLEELEELKNRLNTERHEVEQWEFDELVAEFLDLVQTRYTIQNYYKAFMGLDMWDIQDRVDRHRRVYVERRRPFSEEPEEQGDGS